MPDLANFLTRSVKWGDVWCLDPRRLYNACRRFGWPTDHWWGKANSFSSPLGGASGRGWLLVLRDDLNNVDRDAYLPLRFAENDDRYVEIHQVLFVRAVRVSGGKVEDPNAAFCVEVADCRHLGKFTYADRNYMLRVDGDDLPTLDDNGDEIETEDSWTTLFTHLWSRCPFLGAWPGLPGSFSVDLPPYNVRAIGVSAYATLNALLESFGCCINYDATLDTDNSTLPPFIIVRLGDTAGETALADLIREQEKRLIWDAEAFEGIKAKFPAKIRVFFHAQNYQYDGKWSADVDGAARWETQPFYSVEIPTSDYDVPVSKVATGTVLPLWAAVLAEYSPGDEGGDAPSNQNELDVIAGLLAENYVLRLKNAWLHKIYTGIIKTIPLGPQLTGIRWADVGQGLTTEIIRRSELMQNAADWPKPGTDLVYPANALPLRLGGGEPPTYRVIIGRLNQDMTQAEAAGGVSISIEHWDGEAWADTDVDVSIQSYLRITGTLAENTRVFAFRHQQSERWLIFALGCEAEPAE